MALADAYRELVEIAGRLVQETRHHHNGRGSDLAEARRFSAAPGGVPEVLRDRIRDLEAATTPNRVRTAFGKLTTG